MTWPTLTPLPKFHRCNLSHYTCVKWYFRSMQIWLDVFDPHQNFTGAICHVIPVLNDILGLCRFDLTYLTPPHQNFMDAFCHVTPVLNDILDLCRFDLMYLTPHQNFADVFHHVTPVLNDILDLCRYDLKYFTPLPKFYRCISSHYTWVKWYFRSMQIWLDVFDPPPTKKFTDAFHHVTPQPFNQSASSHSRHNKNHMLRKRSTMLKSISCYWLIHIAV